MKEDDRRIFGLAALIDVVAGQAQPEHFQYAAQYMAGIRDERLPDCVFEAVLLAATICGASEVEHDGE